MENEKVVEKKVEGKSKKGKISFDELMERRIKQVAIPISETSVLYNNLEGLPEPGAVIVWFKAEELDFLKKKLK